MIAPLPDPHPLMDAREPTDDYIVLDHAMSGDGALICHDHAIADNRIVSDMGSCHEQAVVADPRSPRRPPSVPEFIVTPSRMRFRLRRRPDALPRP